jgi:hypothetical protein
MRRYGQGQAMPVVNKTVRIDFNRVKREIEALIEYREVVNLIAILGPDLSKYRKQEVNRVQRLVDKHKEIDYHLNERIIEDKTVTSFII